MFAAKTMAGSAIDLITKPDVLKKIHDEFERRKAGRTYISPVPKDLKPPVEMARKQAGFTD